MHTVSKIQKTAGSKKIKVYEEDKLLFSLYPSEVTAFSLKEDSELSDTVYEQICHEILLPRAKKRVLNLLLSRDRSRHELDEKLFKDGYPTEVAKAAIEYAQSYHYVDDLRLAVTFLRSKQEQKSTQYLKMKLTEKGISRDVIAEAFDQVREERMELMGDEYIEAEQAALLNEIQKKVRTGTELSEKDRQKLFNSLLAKGFRSADIAACLRMESFEY